MDGCTTCGKPLSRRNVSGLCRRHALDLGNLPHNTVKRVGALRRFAADNPDRVREYCTQASRSRLSWCPPEYRDEYRRLTRVKMLPAAESRKVIEDLISAHATRYSRTGKLQQAA
ncbi:hypothetical protein CDQ92_13240 [Sphingopyxis bauzanensis]|uniref:Uncharacterized protein n=2 Tax=Sphingopyxis bauzanensis TaxID=651663 RepID=A0A246JRT2_9SPHN|nr:hypothetical protein CDQ92_13240 [Sphingopyxis bauzanensis]GGJ39639.1 hypothetical protein GCM10011393_07360 [Sphingopyxis bauzanensis]